MASPPVILCLLSDEQQVEYEQEFLDLAKPGLDFVFDDDPEEALPRLTEIDPSVVVVGMDVGSMEGLEILYEIRQQYPDFDRPIAVLPNKGDPFPPVIHTQDAATGRSKADQVELEAIIALIREQAAAEESAAEPVAEELAAPPATPASPVPAAVDPSAAPAPAPAPAAAASPAPPSPAAAASPSPPAAASPTPAAAAPPAKPMISTERAPLPPPVAASVAAAEGRKSKLPMVIGIIVVVAIAAGVVAFFSLGSDDSSSGAGAGVDVAHPAGGGAVAAADGGSGQASAEAGAAAVGEGGAAAPGAPPPETPGEPLMEELARGLNLPYSFRSASTHPTVLDEEQLRNLVETLNRHPEVRIELMGHTSADGRERVNDELGLGRAREVMDNLAALGLDRARMAITSVGGDAPSISNETAEGRSRNRRVSARILR